ncbi:MAG: site-2 protease family protein [Verrucomicrobiales bacterium]|nr:site-2 protease family protein [Verrucomicrobiales bacterium]MCP5526280.1 site-2 protease family protein [Verrucomicrobiales bacterium]
MKWSWRIGRAAGIDVYVHATFLILVGWVALKAYSVRQQMGDVVSGLAFIAALFGIIVLHELGHALSARRYGIPTRDITLLPIGGVARLERMPDKPAQELIVALAGPAVNVVLAILLWLILRSATAMHAIADFRLVGGSFLKNLLYVNIWIASFNLIPAFPMDGGRVLRSLLAMRMEYVRATKIAATIGQALAFMAGAIGLARMDPFIIFVAIFVFLGAEQEADMVRVKSSLDGIPIQSVMIRDFRALLPADPLTRAVEHVIEGFQQDFPVVDGGRVVGVLTRQRMLTALAKYGGAFLVQDAMEREFATASPLEMAETAFARLDECACHSVPVVQDGRLVGLLTAENIGEFLMIRSALQGQPPRV